MKTNSKMPPVKKILSFADVHCILKIAKKEKTVSDRLNKVREILAQKYNIPKRVKMSKLTINQVKVYPSTFVLFFDDEYSPMTVSTDGLKPASFNFWKETIDGRLNFEISAVVDWEKSIDVQSILLINGVV